MIKKKVVLVDKVSYFSIQDHCAGCSGEDSPSPEDYNYEYGARVYLSPTDPQGLIIQLPDRDEPIKVGDLLTIEFVEEDIDDDEIWRLCDR